TNAQKVNRKSLRRVPLANTRYEVRVRFLDAPSNCAKMRLLAYNFKNETCKYLEFFFEFSVTMRRSLYSKWNFRDPLDGARRICREDPYRCHPGVVQRDFRRRSFSQSKNIMNADRNIVAVS